jgi:hypothetical protein
MESGDIKRLATSMGREIQNIIDSYNRLDPAFTFFPEITMIETSTAVSSIKNISVEVQVNYNTKDESKI